MKNTQRQLFERFQILQFKVGSLGGIVQNEGFTPSAEHLQEFTEGADGIISELKSVKAAVIAHFTDDQADLVGEWNDSKKCFWFGAKGCEWIAHKGSNQVFVYPCDEHPAPPSQIIQHTERIENLQEFTNAIRNGVIYNANYKPE